MAKGRIIPRGQNVAAPVAAIPVTAAAAVAAGKAGLLGEHPDEKAEGDGR